MKIMQLSCLFLYDLNLEKRSDAGIPQLFCQSNPFEKYLLQFPLRIEKVNISIISQHIHINYWLFINLGQKQSKSNPKVVRIHFLNII